MSICNNMNINEMNALSRHILSLLSSTKPADQIIIDIAQVVQQTVGFEAVGLRLVNGLDFPYYFTRGFNQDFVEKEMYLCERGHAGNLIRDTEGNPSLECMCGNIISGRTNPELPFFTVDGSFWTNSTSDLLASTSERERHARTRNRCNVEGYESVALIPVKDGGTTYGLLQLNDSRRGMLTKELVLFLEGVCSSIANLFAMRKAQQLLEHQAYELTRVLSERARLLEQISLELKNRNNDAELGDSSTQVIKKLNHILDELELLKGILPICCRCKKIRSESAYWEQIELYISDRSKAEFSHGLCPECYIESMKELGNIRYAIHERHEPTVH